MNSETTPLSAAKPAAARTLYFKEDAVVHAICEPARRRILMGLLPGHALSTGQLATVCGRNPDLTRKHLQVLKDLGMIVCAQATAQDRRRQLYELSPRVLALADQERGELDFGFCLIRHGA